MFLSLSSTTRIWAPAGTLTAPRGQREDERASVADLAVAPDPAAVHLDEALRKREPEAGALLLPGTGLRLLKLLEDAVEILGGDARPGVGHGNPHLAVVLRGGDIDQPARRRELHGVREQVEDHLPNASFISRDGVETAVAVQRHLH